MDFKNALNKIVAEPSARSYKIFISYMEGRIISASLDNTNRIWDPELRECTDIMGGPVRIWHFAGGI